MANSDSLHRRRAFFDVLWFMSEIHALPVSYILQSRVSDLHEYTVYVAIYVLVANCQYHAVSQAESIGPSLNPCCQIPVLLSSQIAKTNSLSALPL